ncbi:CrcB protein [Bhargavaea ginsengi]|uniref:Fluoride-specific ion channel FluC n=1 Tax=Bhargavaea ginsengi TaxID=426757 RepID=A0A1H6Y5G8_9BACL|nr:CrcB family protein [Bhargavaea ginsengi]SEJ34277.1 CrcB protein [Bhargavaea ginsengi]
MTALGWLCVAAGGMLGAVIRYWITSKLNRKGGFPAGTFAVNMTGAFLAGIFSGLAAGSPAHAFIVYGILGALTTFSTWNSEILILWRDGRRAAAVFYALSTLVLGIVFYMVSFIYVSS